MSYMLPTPPASGVVVDQDGIQWRRDANSNWAAVCQTCHTPMAAQSWGDLLRNKGPLEDVPGTTAGLAVEGGPA